MVKSIQLESSSAVTHDEGIKIPDHLLIDAFKDKRRARIITARLSSIRTRTVETLGRKTDTR